MDDAHEATGLECAECLSHRAPTDAELFGEDPFRRKPVPRLVGATRDQLLDLRRDRIREPEPRDGANHVVSVHSGQDSVAFLSGLMSG